MANMSYCRFSNTLADLKDCDRHLWDDDLSEAEEVARKRLLELCRHMAEDWTFNEEDDG